MTAIRSRIQKVQAELTALQKNSMIPKELQVILTLVALALKDLLAEVSQVNKLQLKTLIPQGLAAIDSTPALTANPALQQQLRDFFRQLQQLVAEFDQPAAAPSKERLQTNLQALLAMAELPKEMRKSAAHIAQALDQVIQKNTQQNRRHLEATVIQALILPHSSHFQIADSRIKEAIMDVLEEVAKFLNMGLNDLAAINENIKQDRKKLKERVEQIAQEQRRFGR